MEKEGNKMPPDFHEEFSDSPDDTSPIEERRSAITDAIREAQAPEAWDDRAELEYLKKVLNLRDMRARRDALSRRAQHATEEDRSEYAQAKTEFQTAREEFEKASNALPEGNRYKDAVLPEDEYVRRFNELQGKFSGTPESAGSSGEKAEKPDFSGAKNFQELFAQLQELGSVAGGHGREYPADKLIEKIEETRRIAPGIKGQPYFKGFAPDGLIFGGITFEGGLREKVVELLNSGDAAAQAGQPAEKSREDEEPWKQEFESASNKSPDDISRDTLDDLKGLTLEDASTAGSFDELYRILDAEKMITAPNGAVYTAQALKQKIEKARLLSRVNKGVDWSAVLSEITGGPDKGGDDDLQKNVGRLIRAELGLDTLAPDTRLGGLTQQEARPLDIDAAAGKNDEEKIIPVYRPPAQPSMEPGVPFDVATVERIGENKYVAAMTEKAQKLVGTIFRGLSWGAEKTNMDIRTLNMVDHVRAGFNDRIARWYTAGALKRKGEYVDLAQKVLEADAAVKTEPDFNKREKLIKKAEKAHQQAERMAILLEGQNAKREYFENRRNELCTKMADRVSEGLAPYEEKLSALREKKNNVAGCITDAIDSRNHLQEQYRDLLAAQERANPGQLAEIRRDIKLVKQEIREQKTVIKEGLKQQKKTEKGIGRADKPVAKWREKRNGIVRIMRRRADIDTSAPQGGGETVVSGLTAEKKETEQQFQLSDLFHAWNKRFGHELMLAPDFLAVLSVGDGKTKVTKKDFVSGIRTYGRGRISDVVLGRDIERFLKYVK